MKKLTDNFLTEDVLSQLPIEEYLSFGGEKEKLEKKLNEFYQYNSKYFVKTNKGDYSLLKELVEKEIYIKRFIE